jgi:hypothetical protein
VDDSTTFAAQEPLSFTGRHLSPRAVLSEPWFIAAICFTALNYFACEALRPITGLKGAINPFDRYSLISLGVFYEAGLIFVFAYIISLATSGNRSPLGVVLSRFSLPQVISFLALGALVNLNLTVLGEVKAQLNQLVGFSADAKLAAVDYFLFFGTDPWRAFRWLDHPYLDDVYHYGWIAWITLTLVYLGVQLPSRRKDALLTTYFALWTVGPLIHLLMPAAGPLFFHQLGLGDRFAALPEAPHTYFVQAYLWEGYQTRTINFAGGISAMPSLHIATMAWAAIVFFRTRAFPIAVLFALYVFGGSIITGWHYAIDGIAGAALALATYWVCDRLLGLRRRREII